MPLAPEDITAAGPPRLQPRTHLIVLYYQASGWPGGERYVVASPEFCDLLADLCAQHGVELTWRLEQPCSPIPVEEYQHATALLVELGKLTGELFDPACTITRLLEKALERLRGWTAVQEPVAGGAP
jgi:hypothetical protein